MSRIEQKNQSLPRVYVGGSYDLTHFGHYALFENAADYGEVWVSLNTDEFCARYKRKPVLSLEERMKNILACKWVTGVVVNTGDEDSKPAILEVKPRYVAHGSDWTGESLMEQMQLTPQFLEEHDIEMLYLPYTEGISTSQILARIYENQT